MAKVSLRIYNREIERLIEQGNIEEAIAHCRHILKTFPKHLETYRLLGKAYLEARRYNEAVDVFGRLLMAVPDDFVAHVGLSIIRDEENKLDDALWHMERAFEVQPSNAAIQGELQRLYGRRDGVEPPKVRMTRGALARIYVQGELYPQAIAEIRSVLAEDAQRADMQVLLAYSYFKSGQKSDASDLCNQLLKRYPYSFEANRIMVDLLPATAGSAESTQIYRMRVGELDPYANFTRGSIFETNEISDASVNLERLEYTGEEVPMEQEWGALLGIGAGSMPALSESTNEQPDWLSSAGLGETSSAADEPKAADEIPDFLRAAGWGESKTPEQPTSMFDNEPADDDLVPADLPDWLKGQVPSSHDQKTELRPEPEASASIDTPDWLQGLSGADSGTVAESLETPQESTSLDSETPDWLSGLGAASVTAAAGAMAQPEPQEEAATPADIPDWLKGLEGTPASQEHPTQPVEEASFVEEEPETVAQPADIPDWLKGAEPKEEAPVVASTESLGSSAQEQDDAIAWLESLAAKHGAKPEELVTDPNKRSETPPDWVQQAQTVSQPPVPVIEETPVQQPPVASAESLGSSAQEQDDAIAWLESLAEKHGAKPEELVTDPNKRSETPPDWVQQAQTIGETPVPAEPESAKTDWIENAQDVGEEFFAEFEKGASQPATDETGMWLRNLEGGEKAEKPIEADADLPDWMKPEAEEQPLERGEIPEWLNEPALPTEQPAGAQDLAEPASGDLPNWLDGLEQETHVTADQVMGNQDLSDWLSGLDSEPGLELDPALLQASQRPPFPSQPEKPAESSEPTATDLPGWLSDVNSEAEAEDELWKQTQPPASIPTEEPVSAQETSVTLSADLPDWLQGVEEETEASGSGEDLPPWLHREQWEGEAVAEQPKPTSPSDWHPISEKPAQVEKPVAQERAPKLVQNPPSPEPVEKVEKKKAPAKQAAPARQRKPEAQGGVSLLNQARSELDRGDIPEALIHYGKLIKKGKHLEEIISHLNDSLYRYPVEVSIWQALGDAYMRANRLKEALDSYNKEEELIR